MITAAVVTAVIPGRRRAYRQSRPTGLIRRARTMLAELTRAGEEISALRDGDGGVVAIGTVMSPAVNTLVDALEAMRDRTARSQITVHVDTSDVLAELLMASKLDFTISRIPAGLDPGPLEYQEADEEEGEGEDE